MRKPRFAIIAPLVDSVESGRPFGVLTPYLRALYDRAIAQGWECVVCSPRDVLRQRRVIWAWIRIDSTWERQFVDLPHVVYTRLPGATAEDMEILFWLRNEGGVQFINQPELEEITSDQWRLLQILQSHPTLGSALPESVLLVSDRSIESLFEEASSLRVIGRRSKVGLSEGSVVRRGDLYTLRYEQAGKGVTRDFRSVSSLRSKLEALYGEVVLSPLAPQARFEDCPILSRHLWQRTRLGGWNEQAVMLLLGQPKSLTYQAATVGLLDRYHSTLEQLLGDAYEAVRYQMSNTSKLAAELLDARVHGVGELAVDLVVTEDRSVKLVTASTTAGVSSVWKLTNPMVARATMQETLVYAGVLADHVRLSTEETG